MTQDRGENEGKSPSQVTPGSPSPSQGGLQSELHSSISLPLSECTTDGEQDRPWQACGINLVPDSALM